MAQVLIVLFIVLALVTLVGHAIWVLLAWLFRTLSDEAPRPRSHHAILDEDRSAFLAEGSATPTDLPTIISMLRRLADEGALERNEVDALVARIVAFRRERQAPARPAAPPPIPEAAPPVVPVIEAELHAPAAVQPPAAVPFAPVEEPPRPEPTPAPLVAAMVAPAPIAAPRKPLGEILTEFMAPHNIRWGEIIGGLLFVVGAAALVITQWETLQHLRYFRFVIAMAVSAGVFGLGLYSHYRWKLAATSRGLLTIATLLVPLNFLNLAGLAKADPLWITATLEIAAAGLFAALLSFSAQVLVPGGRARQVIALLGISLVALWFARRFDPHAGLAWLSLAGCVPVALAAGASGSYLWSVGRRARLAPQRAVAVFHLLGSTVFAACIALGVLAFRVAEASHWSVAVDGLAAAAELAGAALLLAGLMIRRRLRCGARAEPHRLAAMWIALSGGLLMLTALGMAWPRPELLLPTAAFAAITLLTAAVWFAVPALHIGAQASAAVAYVVGFLLASGALAGVAEHDLGRAMLRGALGAPCGAAFCGLVALLAVIGETLCRRRRAADGLVYFSGAGIVAAVSLAIVSAVHPHDPVRATVIYTLYGLGALALNVRLLRPALTYVGSALLAGAALWWAKDHVTQPWSMAFLAHATAVGLAAWGLRVTIGAVDTVRRAFVEPLGHTSLVSSVAALAAMFLFPWQSTSAVAAALLWLSLIWLAVAWVHRWPAVFAAHQAALAAAVATWLYGVYDGHLQSDRAINLFQAWLIALGLLALGWTLLRIALRRNHVMRGLLNPGWPMLDQVCKHALAPLQLAAMAPALIVGVQVEFDLIFLERVAPQFLLSPFSLGAWLALAALGLALVASLWDRWRWMELLDAIVAAGALACLVAASCLPNGPLATAMRWTLATAFVLCSACVWQRGRLASGVRALGARLRLEGHEAQIARTAILVLMLGPVLLITSVPSLGIFFSHDPLIVPQVGLLGRLSPAVSYVVPLLLLAVGLVGHALRERSAGYVFSAGLLVELAVGIGYPLSLYCLSHARPCSEDIVHWIQWMTVASAAWALGWVAGRKFLRLWTEEPEEGLSRALMNVQLAFGYLGNAMCLAPALWGLIVWMVNRQPMGVIIANGSWLGWTALALAAAAGAARTRQAGRRVNFDSIGLLGMAVLGLLACTVQRFWIDWGYRTLMLGWSGYALAAAAAAWGAASLRLIPDAKGRLRDLSRAAALWVSRAGAAAVLLGLWAAPHYEQQLWAAAAIAIASLAGAAMAVWRRQEGWAFAAALGLNLAASLVVWHDHYQMDLAHWWIVLVQANTIASAAAALIWLAARRRLRQLGQLSLAGGPLLGLQTALGVAGNVILLGLYACRMFLGQDLGDLIPLAHAPGWTALILAAAAGTWCLWQAAPAQLGHVPGALVLGLVTLGSGLALPHLAQHPLLHLHIYVHGLAAGALVALGAGFLWERTGKQFRVVLSPAAVEGWTLLLAALAVGCALRWCGSDPRGPWPLVAGVLVASAAVGLLACWRDKVQYVFASIALVCTAGSAVWLTKHHDPSIALLSVNVVCLSLSAAAWTLLELLRPGAVPKFRDPEGDAPVAWYALSLAALALGAAALWGIRAALLPLFHLPASPVRVAPLDWYAWGSLALAMTLQLWDRSARRVWEGLYVTAFLGLGLELLARRFTPDAFCWWSGLALAGFVAATAAAACALPRLKRLGAALQIPLDRPFAAPTAFATAQTALGAAAVALGLWISMDSRFNGLAARWLGNASGRTGGAIALAELLVGAGLMTAALSGAWRRFWQCTAIALAAVLPAVVAWARLSADLALPGLHRQILLMASTGLAALVLALAVGRLIPAASDWAAAARRMIGPIGSLCAGLLAAILAQEAYWNLTSGSVPLTPWAIAAVALTLLALTAGCVALAVSARPDPLGLSERGRQIYVYAAEALLVLIGVHLRLTAPELFRHHIIRRYGMFLVMGLAFLWTGLAEIFRRRERRVLAEPLAITARLLPLAAMVLFFLVGPRTPLVWFLIGLFYSVEAITKRSFWMGAAAVITGNAGLWVLWQQMHLGFLVHPQLWLIPLAVAALAAEHFSRKRLPGGNAAVRSVALGVIYLSSSADMFIAGIGNSLWLPLILMLLAVAGVLGGMALRVRSFVYLGVSFLLFDLATLVKYVAIDLQQTWVFWSCIVLLGAAIIALFAVFEKRRDEIRAALERFRAWRA